MSGYTYSSVAQKCYNTINATITVNKPNPYHNGNNCSLNKGHPINIGTGNKFLKEVDYVGAGHFPLRFIRYYNSYGTDSTINGTWTSTVTSWFHMNSGSATVAYLRRPDGRLLRFNRDTADSLVWTPQVKGSGTLTMNPDLSVVYHGLDGISETYVHSLSHAGVDKWHLTQEVDEHGRTHTYRYEPVSATNEYRLAEIRDDLGGYIRFEYENNPDFLQFDYLESFRISRIVTSAGRSVDYRYGANGNLVEVARSDGTKRTYLYENPDFPHALTGIIDERGVRYATYAYDATGRAIRSELAGGVDRITVDYIDDTNTTLTNSRNVATTYTTTFHRNAMQLASVSGPGCGSCGDGESTYTYYYTGDLQTVTRNGRTTEYGAYDANGNPGYVIEAPGTSQARRTDYTYDPRFTHKVATRTEPSVYASGKRITTWTYDDHANLTRLQIDGYRPDGTPVSRVYTFEYAGPNRQLSKIDGPRTDVADITTLDYYPNDPAEGANRGRVRRVTIGGLIWRDAIRYTASGKVAAETRPNGLVATYTYYPGNDRLATLTLSDGTISQRTRWTYLPTGEVRTITLADGQPEATTLTLDYDDARRLVKVTDGEGNTIEYVLDTEGNRLETRTYDPLGTLQRRLRQAFDAYNHLNSRTRANETTRLDIAPDGALRGTTDGRGTTTRYDYDALRHLVTVTRDAGGADPDTADILERYGYDVHGILNRVEVPTATGSAVTTYTHDDLGNLLSESGPDRGTLRYTADPAGNRIEQTDARGVHVTYRYDALNRLVAIDYPGTAEDVTYEYDNCPNGIGRLCRITDASGTSEYDYDAFGNVLRQRTQIAGVHYVTAYRYDALNRIIEQTLPSGRRITYVRDRNSRPKDVSATVNGSERTIATGIEYAPDGRLTGLTNGNGLAETRTHDEAGRISSLSMPVNAGSGMPTATETMREPIPGQR